MRDKQESDLQRRVSIIVFFLNAYCIILLYVLKTIIEYFHEYMQKAMLEARPCDQQNIAPGCAVNQEPQVDFMTKKLTFPVINEVTKF